MKDIKEITDIFKQEIKKKYTTQIAMPIYMGVSDMEIILEEIERLQKENNKLKFKPKTQFRDVIDLRDENKRLHSIIKEVREYIDRRDIDWGSDEHNHVLEILDKVE